MKLQAFKVSVGDAAGYALNLTLSPEDNAHIAEINECLQHLGATLRQATKDGENTVMSFDVVARDINSFVEHLKTELDTIMSHPAPVTEIKESARKAAPAPKTAAGTRMPDIDEFRAAESTYTGDEDTHQPQEPASYKPLSKGPEILAVLNYYKDYFPGVDLDYVAEYIADNPGDELSYAFISESAGNQMTENMADAIKALWQKLNKQATPEELAESKRLVDEADSPETIARRKKIRELVMSRPLENTARRFNMELIWNRQSFMSVKEKMDATKYAEQGEKEKLDFKPTAPAVPTSQKAEKGLGAQFVEQGEKGKLQYPSVKKDAGIIAGPGKPDGTGPYGRGMGPGKGRADGTGLNQGPRKNTKNLGVPDGTGPRGGTQACPKNPANKNSKEIKMDKQAAQQLPGSDSVDAGSAIEKGDKEKLQFPTKPGPDPKIKMQGLDVSNDAKKQIDGGEKGKIQHGQTKGKDINIEWQVNTDTAIGGKFMETGDKGDAKKVSGPAKEPSVSAQKESGADANIERGEATSGMQKQFSLNFKRASAEEKELAVSTAIDNAILEIEVAASKCGVNITATRMAPIYTGLIALKEGVRKNGSLFAITPAPVAPKAAPIKVQASARVVDMDKAATEIGRRIF